jgi:hypothetical protein
MNMRLTVKTNHHNQYISLGIISKLIEALVVDGYLAQMIIFLSDPSRIA